ncbi:MAG: Maf family nucleotide pyrophosphatase [Chitinophagaceae bacterium]
MVILASQSPRRKQLLEWAEISFEIIVQNTDEIFPPELSLKNIPVHIAKQKAFAVKHYLETENKLIEFPILAADTIVVLKDKIIGKPKNREDAIEILHSLSAKKHKVITGVVILHQKKEIVFSDVTEVIFHALPSSQIEYYVDKYKPYDKAGAYAIQEWIGVVGIKEIKGDFYNVMGLPISRVVKALKQIEN